MRIRSIKPEFWDSQKLGGVSRDARLLFIGLWSLADDFGRFRAHPAKIAGALFAYDDTADVPAWLEELVRIGVVQLYQHEGQDYGLVVGFAEHQKIDKRWASKLPEPQATPAQKKAKRAKVKASRAKPPVSRVDSTQSLPDQSASLPNCSASLADSPPLEQGMEQGVGDGGGVGEEPLDGGMDGGSRTGDRDGVAVRRGSTRDAGAIAAEIAAGVIR